MNFHKVPLAPGLYLVGVPIGTARDITLRALDTLASADRLAAEDTRSLRKLMEIHGVPLAGRRIETLHDHSRDSDIARLLERIAAGESLAYASEAGMPLIADPGFELVRAARERGQCVTCVPGPSALTTALAVAGLPTDAVHFGGFLPNARAARRKALTALAGLSATLVFFESPKRVAALLRDAAETLGPERRVSVCRELTKKFEDVVTGTLGDLAQAPERITAKGEFVVLIEKGSGNVREFDIDSELTAALGAMSVRDAADHVAAIGGLPRRQIYTRALELRQAAARQDD